MIPLASPASQRNLASYSPAMTLFLLSLLVLSVAAVLVTIRAVSQARDGFEDAAGFHGEAAPVARQLETAVRPDMGVRPVSFAS